MYSPTDGTPYPQGAWGPALHSVGFSDHSASAAASTSSAAAASSTHPVPAPPAPPAKPRDPVLKPPKASDEWYAVWQYGDFDENNNVWWWADYEPDFMALLEAHYMSAVETPMEARPGVNGTLFKYDVRKEWSQTNETTHHKRRIRRMLMFHSERDAEDTLAEAIKTWNKNHWDPKLGRQPRTRSTSRTPRPRSGTPTRRPF